MYMDKIEQLMDSNEFVQKLDMTNNVEEMQELFGRYGVEISLEELNRMVAVAHVGVDGELNEEALMNVAGGGWFQKFWDWLCNRNSEGIGEVVDNACGRR